MAFTGVNQFAAIGVEYGFWAVLNGNIPYGTTGTIANGSAAGMGRLRGIKEVSVDEPQPETLYPTGDNGVLSTFLLQPNTLPTGTVTLGAQDQNFAAKSNGLKVYTEGDWDILGFGPPCYNYGQMIMVLNSPAKSLESASLNEKGWVVTILSKVENFSSGLNSLTERAVVDWVNNLTLSRANSTPWGQSYTTTNYASTEFVGLQFSSPYPVTIHTFIGDGTTDDVVLNETPAAATVNAVELWQAGTKKAYTTDYTVVPSTKTFTFVAAPAAAAVSVIPYQFLPVC